MKEFVISIMLILSVLLSYSYGEEVHIEETIVCMCTKEHNDTKEVGACVYEQVKAFNDFVEYKELLMSCEDIFTKIENMENIIEIMEKHCVIDKCSYEGEYTCNWKKISYDMIMELF